MLVKGELDEHLLSFDYDLIGNINLQYTSREFAHPYLNTLIKNLLEKHKIGNKPIILE